MGTGDGGYAYQLAKNRPGTLVIGTDSNADNLRDISHKAARKPSKGGLPNILFGQIVLEQAPGELAGFADSLSVLLPWGSLLQAVACPNIEALARLRSLCKTNADLLIIFGYSPMTDARMVQELELPSLTDEWIHGSLVHCFLEANFKVRAKRISTKEIQELPTTWAKKLAFSGKDRTFVKIEGRGIV